MRETPALPVATGRYLTGTNRRRLITSLAAAAAFPGLATALAFLLAPGSVMLLRHATATGGGDPPGFRLGDRATQCNLSDQGRGRGKP